MTEPAREICAGCTKELGIKWVVALDQKWHRYCFCCDRCKMPIDSKSTFFFEKGAKICVNCAKQDDPSIGEEKVCYGCNKNIERQWVIGLNEKWHPECFKCVQCERVIDPKERFYKEQKDEKDVPKCTGCKLSKDVGDLDLDSKEKKCHGCEREIESSWVVALKQFWHHDCFKCSMCDRVIDSKESFHTNLGKPVCMGCNNDHFRKKCNVCGVPIAGTSLMYKDKNYHHACIKCYICDKSFTEEDQPNIRIVNGTDFKHADCKTK